jgi:hypothetical protein
MIAAAAQAAGKRVTTRWWRITDLESRKSYRDNSDVLWPKTIPPDPRVMAYAQRLVAAGYPAVLRSGDSVGASKVFSSPAARELLEQEFLKIGVHIRDICKHLKETSRPLGWSGLTTLGFGAMLVTFRNCPNTAPLAFWVRDPWYPLFPRQTNTDTSLASSWQWHGG